MSHVLRIGVPDQIGYFRVFNDDGSAKSDFGSGTAGASLSVFRTGLSAISIAVLSDKAADNTTHADGAIRQVGGNLYTVDLPDSAAAIYCPSIGVRGSFTGGVIEPIPHPLATSLSTLQRVALPGYAAPNYQGAINVTEDRVEGVDVTVPVFNFSETKYLANGIVTPAFKYNIFQLTGRVNGAVFKGYAKGELLFLGASGSKRGKERWAVTYKFAASPNVIGMPVGNGGLVVSKEGWEHLWVRFEDDIHSNRLIKIPVAYYVERVYPYGDLSGLGI